MLENIKSLLADDRLYLALVVVCVGVAAFGLGRLSVTESTPAGSGAVGLTRPAPVAAPLPPPPEAPVSPETAYVASKNGTKYHLATCPGAKQIAEANKIWFASPAEAAAAGYTPAANCPGL